LHLKAPNKHSQVDIYSGASFYSGRYAGIKITTYINAPAMGVSTIIQSFTKKYTMSNSTYCNNEPFESILAAIGHSLVAKGK
jgi:hypothetical protein